MPFIAAFLVLASASPSATAPPPSTPALSRPAPAPDEVCVVDAEHDCNWAGPTVTIEPTLPRDLGSK